MNARRTLKVAALVTCSLLFGWQALRQLAGSPEQRLGLDWYREREVVDRHGTPLRRLSSSHGLRGAPIELEAVGDRLISATLVSEDRRFYEHAGLDYGAMLRAAQQNVRKGRIVSGASTVTQQLVKLLDSEGEAIPRGPLRKLVEAARAENLERSLSKREILTAYVNRLNYGRGLVGPERAARTMFGKPPNQLAWEEATFLAVLPRAPSYLDPYRHKDRVLLRQRALLEALHEHGFLSKLELARALASEVELVPVAHPFEAPHFVERVLGASQAPPASNSLHTTLDLALERDVEAILESHRQRLSSAGADNAAAVVVDNASGEVLAYVGSLDYEHPDSGKVDHAGALRQAGSTLKPFVYALAFADGLDAGAPLPDVPTRFDAGGTNYAPDNFDHVFHGPVNARTALASSLNVPAVRTAAKLPPGTLLAFLRSAGLTSLSEPAEHYGLSLALGSGEVSLSELTAAYAMLARQGRALSLRSTVADPTALGKPQAGAKLLPADAVAQVTDSLADPLARVLGLGGQGPFVLAFPVAVKTGTSSGYRDGWTLGYTHERTVGIWVGNSDGSPTRRLTGASGAGLVFADVMRRTMKEVSAPEPLYERSLLVEVDACPFSGLPRAPDCPGAQRRKIPRAMLERWSHESCPFHRHGHSEPEPVPRRYACGAGTQPLVVLPDEYREWLAAQPYGAPGRDPNGIPWLSASETQGCSEAPTSGLEIALSAPSAGSVLLTDESTGSAWVRARAELRGHTGASGPELEFALDGRVVARAGAPYEVELYAARGDHELLVRPARAELGARLATVQFSVR